MAAAVGADLKQSGLNPPNAVYLLIEYASSFGHFQQNSGCCVVAVYAARHWVRLARCSLMCRGAFRGLGVFVPWSTSVRLAF